MFLESKIEAIYRSNVCVRWDDVGKVYYFTPKDFPGLVQISHPFLGEWGQKLQGYFYYYGTPSADRVVILDHGMTCGHRLYMTEISTLAKAGYLVFSYDHTGCVESEGQNANGMVQSLSDLNCCLKDLKSIPELKDATYAVWGHSWGGFAAMNISVYHPEVTHIVSLAGYVSIKQMCAQKFRGILTPFRNLPERLEQEWNPVYSKLNGIESMKKTGVKALIIQSADDKTVSKKYHFDVIKKAFAGDDNVSFLLVDHRLHNPNYTDDAVTYKCYGIRIRDKKYKRGELNTPEAIAEFHASYDWHRMTAQDEKVWEKIFEHLKK